ncbi:zinc finger protein 226-like [Cloeon dipterum]|uniref:zinc finger protein 226-like n=1 Tax=Cloeon dipterum TaxID=197152 RepID=UPI003220534E
MLHVRPPCLLCKCPTANGGVHPSKVDKKKLDVLLGREVIDDHVLICYFCIWQTRCLEEVTSSAWSPRQMRLDSTTKQLRKHYFASNVRQCYVKLRQIDLPSRHEGNDQLIIPPDFREAARMCVKAVYKRPKEEDGYVRFKCLFCTKNFTSMSQYKLHVTIDHSQFSIGCPSFGCISFFADEEEMKRHYDIFHKKGFEVTQTNPRRKLYQTTFFICDECNLFFSTRGQLRKHCATETRERKKQRKSRPIVSCDNCYKLFQYEGALQKHRQLCGLFSCYECSTSFYLQKDLDDHMRKIHPEVEIVMLPFEQASFLY